MSEDKQTELHYDQVDLPKGPGIYSSSGLYDAMFELGDFYLRQEPYIVLDAMCGAGLVGKEISKRVAQKNIMHFCDVTERKIADLREQGYDAQVSSVFDLAYPDRNFDHVYARFGVKNYPAEEQVQILSNFRRVMKDKGIFILCDMESPEQAYEFMQAERREKHKYTRLEGSEPHIPTRQMWFQLLRQSGLEPQKVSETTSYVTTTDWVKSNQMTAEDIQKMNAFLLAAPESAKSALNIREENGSVKIDYPVVVISAVPV